MYRHDPFSLPPSLPPPLLPPLPLLPPSPSPSPSSARVVAVRRVAGPGGLAQQTCYAIEQPGLPTRQITRTVIIRPANQRANDPNLPPTYDQAVTGADRSVKVDDGGAAPPTSESATSGEMVPSAPLESASIQAPPSSPPLPPPSSPPPSSTYSAPPSSSPPPLLPPSPPSPLYRHGRCGCCRQ